MISDSKTDFEKYNGYETDENNPFFGNVGIYFIPDFREIPPQNNFLMYNRKRPEQSNAIISAENAPITLSAKQRSYNEYKLRIAQNKEFKKQQKEDENALILKAIKASKEKSSREDLEGPGGKYTIQYLRDSYSKYIKQVISKKYDNKFDQSKKKETIEKFVTIVLDDFVENQKKLNMEKRKKQLESQKEEEKRIPLQYVNKKTLEVTVPKVLERIFRGEAPMSANYKVFHADIGKLNPEILDNLLKSDKKD